MGASWPAARGSRGDEGQLPTAETSGWLQAGGETA